MSAVEVLAPGESVSALVREATSEYELGCQAAANALHHWMAAGDRLLALRRQLGMERDGAFTKWAEEHTSIPGTYVFRFMRYATYRHHIEAAGAETISAAQSAVTGLPAIGHGKGEVPDAPKRRQIAQEMRSQGASYSAISQMVGVSQATAFRWANPEEAKARKARERAAAKERAKGRARARRDSAVRKVGGGVAESYSHLRKAAQALDRAGMEADSRELRAAVTAALAKVYGAEDEIVRALGIA